MTRNPVNIRTLLSNTIFVLIIAALALLLVSRVAAFTEGTFGGFYADCHTQETCP